MPKKTEKEVDKTLSANEKLDAIAENVKKTQDESAEFKASIDDNAEAIEKKASNDDLDKANTVIATLTANMEALEAKMEAPEFKKGEVDNVIPFTDMYQDGDKLPSDLAKLGNKSFNMEVKALNASRSITGSSVEGQSTISEMFFGNVFRTIGTRIYTASSSSITVPFLSGSAGVSKNGAVKAQPVAEGGEATIKAISLVFDSWAARQDVSIETIEDLPNFDMTFANHQTMQLVEAEAKEFTKTLELAASATAAQTTTTPVGKTTVADLELADFAKAFFNLEPQYRANASWLVGSDVMAKLRSLEQSSTGGDLVWDASAAEFLLFGKSVTENAYAVTGATGKPVAHFANWGLATAIGNRKNMTFSRFAETVPGSIVYFAEFRSQFAMIDPKAITRLKLR